MPVSLVRASIMCTLVCMSALAGGNPLSEGNLYLAAFLILLFAPLSLFDVGFQMSFVSVLSILKLMPFVAPPRVIASSPAGKLWAFMAVSLCAQAGVAALVAYHFHNFSHLFHVVQPCRCAHGNGHSLPFVRPCRPVVASSRGGSGWLAAQNPSAFSVFLS